MQPINWFKSLLGFGQSTTEDLEAAKLAARRIRLALERGADQVEAIFGVGPEAPTIASAEPEPLADSPTAEAEPQPLEKSSRRKKSSSAV